MYLAVVGMFVNARNWWAENVRARFEDETGAVATEYVLLLVLIALAITIGMTALAVALNQKFQDTADTLTGVT